MALAPAVIVFDAFFDLEAAEYLARIATWFVCRKNYLPVAKCRFVAGGRKPPVPAVVNIEAVVRQDMKARKVLRLQGDCGILDARVRKVHGVRIASMV